MYIHTCIYIETYTCDYEYKLNYTVALIIFWPKCMRKIVLHLIYVYIWLKTADMFLIQLPFIMKSLDKFMNYEFILWWKIKWDVLFQSKHLGTSQKRQTYSLPGMYYSLGKMKVYLCFSWTHSHPSGSSDSRVAVMTVSGCLVWPCANLQCDVLA